MPSTHLTFEKLCRGFGRLRVLDKLDGHVEGGELLLITGANGSGKSTLLRCLAGLMAPQSGTIRCAVDDRSLDTAERRRAVGYVAPDLELYAELSVDENLAFFSDLRGVDAARGVALRRHLGLPGNRLAGYLSSGMRQRLRWAWALLHRPRVLLLDEPLQNLDEPGRKAVLELLVEHLDEGLVAVANPDPLELPHVAKRLDLGS